MYYNHIYDGNIANKKIKQVIKWDHNIDLKTVNFF
jgi:hypothetical protein